LVALVLTTAVAIGGYVALFLGSMIRHRSWDHLTELLFLWQAQTGAAFALATALIGAAVIVDQTQAAERRAEEQRERRAGALWAVSSLMLTELSDYGTSCALIYVKAINPPMVNLSGVPPQRPGQWRWPHGESLPPLPVGLVDRLADLIEASAPDHARPLKTLANVVQIQHARARNLQHDIQRQTQLGPNRRIEGIVTRANLIASPCRLCRPGSPVTLYAVYLEKSGGHNESVQSHGQSRCRHRW
jgi:hypothetical protein